MIIKHHLICINTVDLVKTPEQLNQFCNYVEFIYKSREFIKKNNYSGFLDFAKDKQRVKKLPNCYINYLKLINKETFRRYITKTYYTNEKFFNTLYIPCGNGSEVCVDNDNTYFHLTLNSNKKRENSYRSSKGKVVIDYTSNIGSSFEESKIYRVIPCRTTKYAFDKFLFSSIAKVNGLFICIPYDFTDEDLNILKTGSKHNKIELLNKCKIKIRFQVNFDEKIENYINKYKISKKYEILNQYRLSTLSERDELEFFKTYYGILGKIKRYAKDSDNAEKYNNYLLDYNYLICGNVYRKVSDETKRLLYPNNASWYTTIGSYAQLSFLKNCDDSFDFICSLYSVIRKDLNNCYKQKAKNAKKIENLHKIQEGLIYAFPEYELPIKEANENNIDLKILIADYILKDKVMYSGDIFPEIMECNPLYENSFVL